MLSEERYFMLMEDVKKSKYLTRKQKEASLKNLKESFYKYQKCNNHLFEY